MSAFIRKHWQNAPSALLGAAAMWHWGWRGVVILLAVYSLCFFLWLGLKVAWGMDRLTLLEAVDALGPDAYGLRIQQWLGRKCGRKPSLGWVYLELQGLVEAGELVTWEADPTLERGMRPKRFYTPREKANASW